MIPTYFLFLTNLPPFSSHTVLWAGDSITDPLKAFVSTFPIPVLCSPVIPWAFLRFQIIPEWGRKQANSCIWASWKFSFLLAICSCWLFSPAVSHCQFYSAPSYSDRKFHTELGSLIKSTWNDLQFLLISTTVEFLQVVKLAAALELQNGTPQGAASSPGQQPCHPHSTQLGQCHTTATPSLQWLCHLLPVVQQRAARNWMQKVS